MQKKRPRSKGSQHSGSEVASSAPAESGRTVRVRSRLVAGVAVVGITVIAAGAPAALSASSDLTESQRLVTLAELNQQAIALAHSLADERDEVTAFIAAGREGKPGATSGSAGSRSARVDQQVDEIRDAASAVLRRDLSTIPSLRRDAISGKGTALEAHQAYTEVISKLHDLAEELADNTSPRAAEAVRAPSPSAGPPNRPPPPADCCSPRSPSPARSRPSRRSTPSPACPSRHRTRARPRRTASATS